MWRYLQVVYVQQPDERVDFDALSPADFLAYEARDDILYVIHAMPMTDRQKRGKIDALGVVLRALCVDADGKMTVTELKKQLPLNARGIRKVDLVDTLYLSTIKHRNNNLEVPRNIYV